MESKKDIGTYFKQNLEQLDYSPSNKVWDGIEVKLKQKKKKRFFGFWLFFAVIAISSLLTYTYFSDSNSGKPNTNSVGTLDVNNSNENNTNSNNSNATNQNSDVANSENLNSNSNSTDSSNPSATNLNNNANESITDVSSKSGKNNLNDKSTSGKLANSVKTATEKNLKNNLSKKSKKSKYKIESNKDDNSSLLAGNKAGKHPKKEKKTNSANIKKEYNVAGKSDDATKDNNPNFDTLKTSEDLTVLTSEKQKDKKISYEELKKNKKLSLDELKKANLKKSDSIAAVKKAERDKKVLTEKPKDREEKDSAATKITEKNQGIIIAPYYGFNYTGNLGKGNFLNKSKTSKKTGEFISSYGFLIRLMGNKKIGVQLGLGMINSVYSAIFIKETNSFITQNDVKLNTTASLQEINDLFPNGTKITSRQETSFIEVPVEAYYIFSDKKFGMATAFGASFLKFQNNDLYLESDAVNRMKIGNLRNISPFSWSVNVKLNLFYKITPKLNFDLYPSIQYQFMGYKEVNDYQPYFFSIKTGLSYKL